MQVPLEYTQVLNIISETTPALYTGYWSWLLFHSQSVFGNVL